jgi:hypothetical protein
MLETHLDAISGIHQQQQQQQQQQRQDAGSRQGVWGMKLGR